MTEELKNQLIVTAASLFLGLVTKVLYKLFKHWLSKQSGQATLPAPLPQPSAPLHEVDPEEAVAAAPPAVLTTANVCIVCAALGLLTSGVTSIPAVVAGHLALRDIGASKGRLLGTGRTYLGLVLGYLGVLALVSNLFAPPPMPIYPVFPFYPMNSYSETWPMP
jgi:hypothetical protein